MICDGEKLSDILDEETISNLCDCGRHKKKTIQPPLRRQRQNFKTAYGDTFHEHHDVRPRSSKRPPASPRDPNPPPMTFDTIQRSQFRPIRNAERAKPTKLDESFQPSSEPMVFDTHYGREFIFKETEPSTKKVAGPSDSRQVPSGRMESQTTSKEHFKQWVAQPQLAFQELPSFAGSILYPEKASFPESTARNSYKGQYVPPIDVAKSSAINCNIHLEGEMSMETTARDAYKGYSGYNRALPINPRPKINDYPKGRFQGETQSKHDFPGFKNGNQPSPPKAIDPPQSTIDLRFDNRLTFDTEQRATFRGHDIRQHPVAKSCKSEKENFEPPKTKFEGLTSHRRDYMPIDLDTAFVSKISKPVQQIHKGEKGDPKFDGTTMNNEFFKNWGPQVNPRRRYGDFHESHKYVPSMEPFADESTSRKTYTPKKAEATTNYKPSSKPAQVVGDFDFDTEYRLSYIGKKPTMCKAQAYLMEQELARRKSKPSGQTVSVAD